MTPLLISFSGGRTSALMTKILMEHPKYKYTEKLIVFANTGKEYEETLEFVNECDKRWNLNVVWIEADVNEKHGKGTSYKIVDFETASRNGEPFEAVIKKYGLPSKLFRHCTRELKQIPIHKLAKSILGENYLTAIGIRADEKHRVGNNDTYIYPMNEWGITSEVVRAWWAKQDFDLNLKDYQGNCDLCFLKSKRKKLTILSENENIGEWWLQMEKKYTRELQPIFDVIGDNSISKLILESKHKFRKQIDSYDKDNMKLFDPSMDIEFECFCKNS